MSPTPRTTTSTPTATKAESPSAAASRYQQLRSHLAELKLAAAAEALPAVLDQATAEGLSLTVALEQLLAVEVEASAARRLAGRLGFAYLPTPATRDDFDVDAAAGIDRKLIDELGTCRYLDSATNILLIGPPGTEKTHLSVGLAKAAAYSGYRSYFTTAADLAARCHRAAIEGRWATTMRFYAGPTLLVIDELGYLPLPAEAASAWFQVVSQRYSKPGSSSPPTAAWEPGVKSSATPPWPPPCSIACCTAPWSSTSTASPTACATTTPPPKPCAEPPPAPANHYTDRCSQVRKFGEQDRGFSMSAIRVTSFHECCPWLSVAMPNKGSGSCSPKSSTPAATTMIRIRRIGARPRRWTGEEGQLQAMYWASAQCQPRRLS